jgi:hypothetical protein
MAEINGDSGSSGLEVSIPIPEMFEIFQRIGEGAKKTVSILTLNPIKGVRKAIANGITTIF